MGRTERSTYNEERGYVTPPQPSDRRTILDIDGEHFERHTSAITDELAKLTNLYLPPRTRGRVLDLLADIKGLIVQYHEEVGR